jgi:hypothetical protein
MAGKRAAVRAARHSRPDLSGPVGPADHPDLAEWRALAGIERAKRRTAEVRQDEPLHAMPASLLGRGEGREVTTDAAGEPDRSRPTGRITEQQVGA